MPQPRAQAKSTHRASLTGSMVAAAIQPKRYYLMPLRINAMHYTVTAIPKWMDKHQTSRTPNAEPIIRPVLLDVLVLAVVLRGILRANSGRRHH